MSKGVLWVISLIVVSIVVINLFGRGSAEPETLLREIVLILAGAFGNEVAHSIKRNNE